MRHLPIMARVKSIVGLALTTWLAFGLVETANAAGCADIQVTINGMEATSCGWGNTTEDTTDGDAWQVNLNSAGGRQDWALYEREVSVAGGDNSHEGNTSAINLISSQISDNLLQTGVMSLNVFNPTLITLTDGGATLYHWYYFEGITGTALDGSWDASEIFGNGNGNGNGNGGGGTQALSYISAYTVVPVPAAVWLFGSGLLGLFGIAGRGKTT